MESIERLLDVARRERAAFDVALGADANNGEYQAAIRAFEGGAPDGPDIFPAGRTARLLSELAPWSASSDFGRAYQVAAVDAKWHGLPDVLGKNLADLLEAHRALVQEARAAQELSRPRLTMTTERHTMAVDAVVRLLAGTGMDDDAYILAAPKVWGAHYDYRQQFTRKFKDIPKNVIRRRGSGAALKVHADDWKRYWADQGKAQDEALGETAMTSTEIEAAARAVREARGQKDA